MPKREVHFFDKARGTSLAAYERGFCEGKINGEKTPIYLAHPVALAHLADALPDVKLIVLLRDPVKRFASGCHHWNRKHRGKQVKIADFLHTREGYFALYRGMYAVQLQYLYSLIDPAKVHVVISERFRGVPGCVMHDVQGFLGVDPIALYNNPKPDRVVGHGEVRAYLEGKYHQANHALYRMTHNIEILRWSGMGGDDELLQQATDKVEAISAGGEAVEGKGKTEAQRTGRCPHTGGMCSVPEVCQTW
jgi:hypothetical protein